MAKLGDDSVGAPVETVAALAVVSGTGHVIELANAGHHRSRVYASFPDEVDKGAPARKLPA